MELKLPVKVKHRRLIGLSFDKHVLKLEGQKIFHNLNPRKYPSPLVGEYDPDNTEKGVYPLDFSDQLKQGFMERHKFSRCKLVTNMNKKVATPVMMKDIQEYHLECRVLQLSPTPISYMRDPDYGFTSPYYVFSHDQVRPQRPLCCIFDATRVLTRHPQLLFPYD